MITLNVGGVYHYTSAHTLLNSGSRYFEKIAKSNSTDEVFIDRDGGVFNIILNYMRQRKLILDLHVTSSFLEFLQEEAKFYKMINLSHAIDEHVKCTEPECI